MPSAVYGVGVYLRYWTRRLQKKRGIRSDSIPIHPWTRVVKWSSKALFLCDFQKAELKMAKSFNEMGVMMLRDKALDLPCSINQTTVEIGAGY